MKLHPTAIPGCFGVDFQPHHDPRGSFVKTFQASAFRELGLESSFTESFFSTSSEGVIRGMHFQLPPEDGAKFIYALAGEVFDVALDLRIGSPSYGRAVTFTLSLENSTAAYIPRGVAHGFAVTRGPATLVYHVSSEYNAALDAGIRWDSFGLDWPTASPLLSARDQNLPAFADFTSPFRFTPTEASA